MPDPLRLLASRIRELVNDALKNQLPFAEVQEQIRLLFRRAGLAEALLADVTNQARQQYTWIADRTPAPEDRAATTAILTTTANQFATASGGIQKSVVDIVARGFAKNLTRSEIANLLEHELGKAAATSRTIAQTATSAFGRANVFHQASDAGVTKFKYSGPGADRQFCRANLGRIYTLQDLRKLQNGQGLPVEYYCGGYNCRHRWLPVVDES